MGRRNARKLAFYLLFQYDFVNCKESLDELKEVKNTFFSVNTEITEDDRNYIESTTDGAMEHREKIDSLLDTFAKGWTVERMSKVDKAILRLAVYEIKYAPDVPDGVAINEAVELAKTYSSDEAPAFINGILGKISGSEENA